jgi:predicted Zn-dependent protease
MTARAMDLALRTENAVALEPGNYTSILSPECVGDLASTLLFGFDQRSIDEGRSFLSKFKKELAAGEKILSEKCRIYCDPAFAACPGYTFDGEGQPVHAGDWVSNGVIKTIGCSRYWAKKTNREPVPFMTNVLMQGGTSTVDEMIASTKRGIYVNRFWYVRSVDPETALYTGLTRDGCFLIENGKITKPVKNFRWNETPVKMLRNIEMMSPSRRTTTSEQDLNSNLYFPTLKVTDFTFSSLSDAL